MTPKRLLQYASIGEALTWTILLLGMLLKYGVGTADWLVTVGGSLHGAMFLAYLYCGLIVGVNQRFGWGALVLGALSAVAPFATLLYDRWASRRGLLEGDWRRVHVAYADEADADDDADDDATAQGENLFPPAAPAHPADRRVAERGERPARLTWLDPLVRWSADHPWTLGCTALMVCALIFTGAATGSLSAPYKAE